MRVYQTTYDGFYIVVENGKLRAYEGLALCPVRVRKWIEKNGSVELDCFCQDAVSYGYCK